MDQAVALAYGWPIIVNGQVVNPPSASQPSTIDHHPLDLGHGFHATKQGEPYTIGETARRTLVGRLVALNRQRYAEEVKAGLHEKKAKGKRLKAEGRRKKPVLPPAQGELLPGPRTELSLE